jgi:glutamine cyclotransferase
VRDGGQAIDQLNELEFVRGEVWANVWHTNRIARIAPRTGRVVGWIDLSGLMGMYRLDAEAVLNGIAYDAASQRLFVTGKLGRSCSRSRSCRRRRPAPVSAPSRTRRVRRPAWRSRP